MLFDSATIAPIFLVIIAGLGLRGIKLFPADALATVERITYHVLFPSLLFESLASTNMSSLPITEMAIGVIGTPTIIASSILILGRNLPLSGPAFRSLMQGGIRFKTYIGVPLVIAFYGTKTVALGALFIGFMVPFVNVMCVWVHAKNGDGEVNTRGTLAEIARTR